MMHPANKALISKLERLGYTTPVTDDRSPYYRFLRKGDAHVRFEDLEINHVTVKRMHPHGMPVWKATFENAPATLVNDAIKAAGTRAASDTPTTFEG